MAPRSQPAGAAMPAMEGSGDHGPPPHQPPPAAAAPAPSASLSDPRVPRSSKQPPPASRFRAENGGACAGSPQVSSPAWVGGHPDASRPRRRFRSAAGVSGVDPGQAMLDPWEEVGQGVAGAVFAVLRVVVGGDRPGESHGAFQDADVAVHQAPGGRCPGAAAGPVESVRDFLPPPLAGGPSDEPRLSTSDAPPPKLLTRPSLRSSSSHHHRRRQPTPKGTLSSL